MVRPGTTLFRSAVLVMAAAARAWAGTAVTVIGTSCRFSRRRWAVTTISPVVSLVAGAVAAGALAFGGVWATARLGATAIAAMPHMRRMRRSNCMFRPSSFVFATGLVTCS